MLKFIFLILLLANGGLFAYHEGYLDPLVPSGREPERMERQLNADKVKLVVPNMQKAASEASLPVCTEIGNFSMAEAKRIEPQLAALAPADKLSRLEIAELTSHMVLIPPQGGKEGADKKAEDLRALGVTEFYVLQDMADNPWGISLGVFRTEEAARAHLAALQQKGVRSARVVERKTQINRVAFQMRNLDANAHAGLEKLKAELPRHEVRSCS